MEGEERAWEQRWQSVDSPVSLFSTLVLSLQLSECEGVSQPSSSSSLSLLHLAQLARSSRATRSRAQQTRSVLYTTLRPTLTPAHPLTRPHTPSHRVSTHTMATSSSSAPCFTLVAEDPASDSLASLQTADLRAALEKGTDELKLDTLRRIIVATLNGQPQVSAVLSMV